MLTEDQVDDVADRIFDSARIESKHDTVRQVLEAAFEAGWRAPESRRPPGDEQLEHTIRAYAGYDYRDDLDDRRGAHGLDLMFIAKGPLGAVSCRVGTGWMLRPLVRALVGRGPQVRRDKPGVDGSLAGGPSGFGVSSHSLTQDRDWWSETGPCEILEAATCWGGTGYLVSDSVVEALVAGGDEAAFARLDELYAAWLGPEGETSDG